MKASRAAAIQAQSAQQQATDIGDMKDQLDRIEQKLNLVLGISDKAGQQEPEKLTTAKTAVTEVSKPEAVEPQVVPAAGAVETGQQTETAKHLPGPESVETKASGAKETDQPKAKHLPKPKAK